MTSRTKSLGPGIDISHIGQLWDLGYLPLLIKALPEGSLVPVGVPVLTIINTNPDFFWLTNMLETIMSNMLWKACTSATTAFRYRRVFDKYAAQTSSTPDFTVWQGHDFSMRGLTGVEDVMLSGAGHLLSFVGTDNMPAIDFLEYFYGANTDKELVACSVPATEHSVMSIGTPEKETETFRRLLTETYPRGILSVVSDTWDLWNVVDNILPQLKGLILARNGKLVIRPDSGDPADILCGTNPSGWSATYDTTSEAKGLILRLWETFGGTVNAKGYKELDSHIGAIYGDSITLERQEEILSRLKAKGFASTNVVLGIGSYTYQMVTRDTYNFAMKATWGQTKSRGGIAIFKTPKTDAAVGGAKKSAKGLLQVYREDGIFKVIQECTKEEENQGELRPVYVDGQLVNRQTLAQIRERISKQL